MAIEVTALSATDGRDLTIIKDWFDTNATDYFSSSEISEGVLLLKISNRTAVSIESNSTKVEIKVYVNDNLTITKSINGAWIGRLAKTPHGIAMGTSVYSSSSLTQVDYTYSLIVTKTNLNQTGVILAEVLNSNMMNNGFYFVSIGGSMRSSATRVSSANVMADSVTTLTSCICEGAGGEYMPDCFFTSYSQYKHIECTFTADGSEYLYNGFIALR